MTSMGLNRGSITEQLPYNAALEFLAKQTCAKGHAHNVQACGESRLLHLGADPLGDVPARNIIYLARSEIQNAQYIAQHIKTSTK